MRRLLKPTALTAAALAAAVAVYVGATLPPRALKPEMPDREGDGDGRLAWGAYHVHSTASDGSGSVDEVAVAAARAGLQFVIFADHGDATAVSPATYRSGVLCIQSVEINTDAGHVVALGLVSESAYPLAGELRDVVDDIHRLGGVAIAAHPESPRAALRWRAQPAGVDGFEWLNVDSEWRRHGAGKLLGAGLRAIVRAPESLADLFEPPRVFQRWDRAAGQAPMFSLAAVDAHARVGVDADSAVPGASFRLPGYETMFRTVVQAVPLERPPTGDASADARNIVEAIRHRRSYGIVRAIADSRTRFRFDINDAGRASGEVVGMPNATLRLLRNGSSVAEAAGRLDTDVAGTSGDYRLAAFVGDHRFPWLVSDVVRVGQGVFQGQPPRDTGVPLTDRRAELAVGPAEWRIEKHRDSTATLTTTSDGLVLSYRLGAGDPAGQYVALSASPGQQPIAAAKLTASSPAPIRVSVQVRVAGGPDGQRWRRSVYLDSTPRHVTVDLSDMQPVGRTSTLRPVVARVQSVLLVVDTLNARPGSAGEIVVRDARFVQGTPPGGSTSGR